VSANGTKIRTSSPTVGPLIRDWRQRRRLSQLDLASQAEVSPRHLSFVENGRSKPSREMVLHLAEQLDVPLRDRNALLLAAGFAPTYRETDFDAPEMAAVRTAIQQVLTGHEPYPAVAVDRRWNMIDANASMVIFTEGVASELLTPPVNVLRATLHPRGLAPRIVNFSEFHAHILNRLRRELLVTQDPKVRELLEELQAYPSGNDGSPVVDQPSQIVMPLRLRHAGGVLSFFSTIATFGTPADITVEELSIESFFPADEHTAELLRRGRA
jgi:transcriptional regulator with XRE-family HTH domain